MLAESPSRPWGRRRDLGVLVRPLAEDCAEAFNFKQPPVLRLTVLRLTMALDLRSNIVLVRCTETL